MTRVFTLDKYNIKIASNVMLEGVDIAADILDVMLHHVELKEPT